MLEEFIMSERNQWDSSIAFIFAMIGAAVGLGNIAAYFTQNVGGSSNLSNVGFLLIPTTVGVLLLWVFHF